jgi:enoyl-CoA hydratase/carnithine racemase
MDRTGASMSYASYSKAGLVGIVTLERPERLNAISGELLDDLHRAFLQAQCDSSINAIIFTGAGRAFCAGDDLKEFSQQTRDQASIKHHVERIQQITRDIMFGEKPVIGAIHGYAVGGGFEWLLNCDLVVASEELICFFPEMDWGQFVTGAVTHLLPMNVGHQKAMELWLLGERQSSRSLQAMGVVNWVVPRQDMMQKAMAVAETVASKSAASVGRLKSLVTMQLQTQLSTALELEQSATIAAFGTPEAAERVKRFGNR